MLLNKYKNSSLNTKSTEANKKTDNIIVPRSKMNTNYKLADFDFTYVVYAGSNTVTKDSNNIAQVGWPVEIQTDGKSNQQLQFSFSHTNSSYNDNESIALKQLLSDNLMIKEKTITYNN